MGSISRGGRRGIVMVIRAMAEADWGAVSRLCGQLGYATTPEQVAERARRLQGRALVAVDGDAVVGWIHVLAAGYLQDEEHAEIGGLVVEETRRGRGIGEALVKAAEEWASAQGFRSIALRSNIARERAHRFYERLGYRITKTSYRFSKQLED